MPRKLTVVTDSSPRTKRAPRSIRAAAESSERDLLIAMRTKVACDIDAGVPSHALAPLMRQLREIDKEIRGIDARDEEVGEGRGDLPDEAFDPSTV